MRIYISGAITGKEDTAELRFRSATKFLKNLYPDCEIIDPFGIGQVMRLKANPTYQDFMKISFALMDICDAVFFIPDWETSKGCQLERKHAEEHNMNIL